jgi:hypothetical protein
MEKVILVVYINISGLSGEESFEYANRIKETLPINEEIVHYIVPTTEDSRIECIYPKYILQKNNKDIEDLIKENTKVVLEALETFNKNQKSI